MPKYYVESGPVRLVVDAVDAEQAAIKTFQWSCDKQAEIHAQSPVEHLAAAEENGWQLSDVVRVNERGFYRFDDCEIFETLDIVMAWQSHTVPLV